MVAKGAGTAHETYTVRGFIERGGERERMLRQDLKGWYGREAATVSRKDVREWVAKIAKRPPTLPVAS